MILLWRPYRYESQENGWLNDIITLQAHPTNLEAWSVEMTNQAKVQGRYTDRGRQLRDIKIINLLRRSIVSLSRVKRFTSMRVRALEEDWLTKSFRIGYDINLDSSSLCKFEFYAVDRNLSL